MVLTLTVRVYDANSVSVPLGQIFVNEKRPKQLKNNLQWFQVVA